MEYDLESSLENGLTWLAFVFLGTGVAMCSLAFEVRITGNYPALFLASGLPLAVGALVLYLRSLFDDKLVVEGDQLISVRKRGDQTRELSRAPKSSLIEATMNQPGETRKSATVKLLLESGQLLEINFPERAPAEALVAELGVALRSDLSDDVSVTRHQGKPTLRPKNNWEWFLRLVLGLIFLVVYLVITYKILHTR